MARRRCAYCRELFFPLKPGYRYCCKEHYEAHKECQSAWSHANQPCRLRLREFLEDKRREGHHRIPLVDIISSGVYTHNPDRLLVFLRELEEEGCIKIEVSR